MTDSKQNIITSMLAKIKGESIKKPTTILRTISNVKYKYTLFKAKDDGRYYKLNYCLFDYIKQKRMKMYHVTDDNIGKIMYEALNTNEIDVNKIPLKLKNINFIAVNKLKKVVFVTFDIDGDYDWVLELYHKADKEELEDINNIVTWFNDNLSVNDKNINLNTITFLSNYMDGKCSFHESIMRSLYVSDKHYEFTDEDLEKAINMLLYLCNGSGGIDISSLKQNIKASDVPFYNFLNRGIYMREMDKFGFYNLPTYLCANIFKYAKDSSRFKNPKDFFEKGLFEKSYDGNIIFDKELFEKGAQPARENEEFVIYRNILDVFSSNHQIEFFQIKDDNNVENIKSTIKLLSHESLMHNIYVIYSCSDNKHYLCNYIDKTNICRLHMYIAEVSTYENKITELLTRINSLFSGKAFLREKMFLKGKVNYLNLLYYDKHSKVLSFGNIEEMSFKNNKSNEAFQYPLCIMKIIERYLVLNEIKVEDIYKCSFIKLFSQKFINDTICYINTKEYKNIGMIGKLRSVLDEEDVFKIEFLENISLKDTDTIQKITFIPGIENELIQKIKEAKTKVSSKRQAEYISLEERIDFLTRNENLSLSKKLLDKLTYCFDSPSFLIPQKVIISKDIYDETNYTIIGAIWNEYKLYTLFELVKSGDINAKNIYQKVISKIMQLHEESCYADNIDIGTLLFDDDMNLMFDCNACDSLSRIRYNRRITTKGYYTNILEKMSNRFGAGLHGMVYFTYDEIYCNNNSDGVSVGFDRVKYCNEHQKLFLEGNMCKDCQKIYIIAKNFNFEMLLALNGKYEIFNMKPTLFKGSGIACRFPKSEIAHVVEQVKIGIENSIYDKFEFLTPRKVIIKQYVPNKKVFGIMYDDYDFSDMIELTTFKHAQRLKVALVFYKKLLPYIEDGSFVSYNKEIFSTIFMDKTQKGELIIPNLPLLQSDVIISEDEKAKEIGKQKTLKLFWEFLHEYIISDKVLNVEIQNNDALISKIAQSIKNGDVAEADIREYLQSKDSHCAVHGVYFLSSDGICPECIADGIKKENVIILGKKYFDDFKSKEFEYEGGEANLYLNSDGQIEKIFNDDVDLSFKTKVIGKALEKAKLIEEFNNTHEDIKFVPINEVLYSYDDNGALKLEGYRQQYIPDSFKISSLKDRSFVEKLGYSRKDVVEVLMKVCTGIEFLHSIGVFIGDLNGGNILIKDKKVYIIDMDGMSYDNVKNYMYTNMYIYPPSVENKNISKLDDWYSLAVQAFYYLTYSHPFRGISNRKNIPENEIDRMKYGYSVLGNHGIKIPSISVGWDFMPKELTNFFLETFEKQKRENMFEILNYYLKHLDKSEMKFTEIPRKNEVACSISEKIYIGTDKVLYYNEEKKLKFVSNKNTYDVEMYDLCVVIKNDNNVVSINKENGKVHVFNKTYDSIYYALNNRIYYNKYDNDKIFVDEVDENNNITTYELKRATDNFVWNMCMNEEDKYVFLEENEDEGTYDIYCNTNEMYSISQDEIDDSDESMILYDKVSDSWLVIISCLDNQKCIFIDSKGKCSEFTLDVNEISESAVFYKNTLYFASDKRIYVYSLRTNSLKFIYSDVVTSESYIERNGNKFVIINPKTTHMYCKS